MRCFISVDLEDPDLLDALEEAQRGLQTTGADIKCVERENIHLTLRFLGDVRESLLDRLQQLVSNTEVNPFRLELKGLGAFPKLHRPRVIWAGISDGVEELTHIFQNINRELVEMGFKPERRGFSPHITIARVRSGRNREKLAENVRRHSNVLFGGFEVKHVLLKKSALTPRGPIYTTLAESTK